MIQIQNVFKKDREKQVGTKSTLKVANMKTCGTTHLKFGRVDPLCWGYYDPKFHVPTWILFVSH